MPRLLDNRLVGPNADVANRVLYGATAGWALVVNSDGRSMILAEKAGPTGATGPTGPTGSLGPVTNYAYGAREAYTNDEGSSLQQWLATKWVDITPPNNMFSSVNGIAYGKGFFVAVGTDSSNNSPMIAYASVQAGGTTWTVADTIGFRGPVLGVTHGNGVFMACGTNGEIAYSTVGQVWNMVRTGVDNSALYRVVYGYPRGWVAVGTNGSGSKGPGVTLHSSDGTTWTTGKPALDDEFATGVPIYSVGFAQGVYIAVGGISNSATYTNHISTSIDGINWTQQTTPQPMAAHYSIDFGNGRLVVGTNGTYTTPAYGSSIIGSNDGITWYESSHESSQTANLGNVQGVAFGNGTFVAGSSRSMQVTIDGINFFDAYDTGWTADCAGAAYGNGIFVMGSRAGKIIRSSMLNEYVGSTATPPVPSGNGNGGSEANIGGINAGDGTGGGGCFVASTPVLMPDSTTRSISSIIAGDTIQGDAGLVTVLSVHNRTRDYEMVDFNQLGYWITSEQAMLTDQGWGAFDVQRLRELEPLTYQQLLSQNNNRPLVTIQEGMKLGTWEDNQVVFEKTVSNVSKTIQNVQVWWLKVTNDEHFIANGIVVHNNKG